MLTELCLQVLSVPFVLTNEHVGDISVQSSDWLGKLDKNHSLVWADLLVAMVTK